MKKKIALITLASLMAFGVTAQAESDDQITAYFVAVMQGGSVWGQAEAGFNQACEELGWEGYYVAPAAMNDFSEMVSLTETALTNGADVILGTFDETFTDVLTEAKADGVKIAGINSYINEDCQDFWIGTDPEGMGIAQAQALVDLVGDEEVTVIYMQTNSTSSTQNDQFAAFEEALSEYENITVWGQEYCDSSEITAAETISNLVKANSQINAVVCADGYGSVGAANYVEENGVEDSFYSIGIDDDATILNYVTSGALDCTVAQDFYTMGYQSCYLIQSVLDGETVEFANDSGSVIVSGDDVASYAEEKGIEID